MTVTAPVYSARILGTPDIPVSIRNDTGRIISDSSRAPHVDASVTLSVEDALLLEDIDPRDNRRMVIEAGGRSFDLGIREASPNRGDAIVEVQLASDEALLGDFAQLVDDLGAWLLQASLRDVVDYVLDKIGAHLEPGSTDADMTAFWEVTNFIPNPSVRGVLGKWIAGGSNGALTRQTGLAGSPVPGVTTYTRTTWSGNSGSGQGGAYGQTGTVAPVVTCDAFGVYRLAVWVRSNVAKPVRLSVQIFAQDGSVLNGGLDIGTETLVANAWTLLEGTFTTPANAAKLGVFTYVQPGSQWTSGNTYDTLGWILHEGTLPVPSFDASTVDANYIYAASGDAHVSASTRTPFPLERSPEALIWQAGTSGLSFLAPLVQAAGFRLVCNERREWTLRDEAYREDGGLSYRYGVNLIAADETLARSAEEWFDGAVFVYTWTDRDGIEQTRTDAYALTADPTKVIRREIDAPYPGPGRAEYAVRRAQGRGRTVTVTTQAQWNEAAEQPLTTTLDGTPIQTGTANRVEFDLAANTVTVTSRTTDTPAAAWVLIPVGEQWIDSPVGESWTEEII